MNKLFHGDCLDILPTIPDASVDLVITDLPFGQTRNAWDKVIPQDALWAQFNRIAKPNAAMIFFAQKLFAFKLALSNEKNFREDLVWRKNERITGHLDCDRKHLRNHELILVFWRKQCTYNPQFTTGAPSHSRGSKKTITNNNYGAFEAQGGSSKNGDQKYPKSVLNFDPPHPKKHPTQKPVPLLEYLIKTYSNSGDVVLDPTMGIGTTCKAAQNCGRQYIGIEKEKKYFDDAVDDIYGELFKPQL